MGVSHGRTRIADLSFQVYSRAVHPDWFGVREHLRVGRDRWEADLRVIDGGHALTFRYENVRLTEVLCGPDTMLPETGLLFHSPIRHERTATLRPNPVVEFHTCFEVEQVDPEIFAHLSDEMSHDQGTGRLFHEFPARSRLAPPAIIHLRYEAKARGLLVHAFHSFPEERAIVRTQSLFEPKRLPQ